MYHICGALDLGPKSQIYSVFRVRQIILKYNQFVLFAYFFEITNLPCYQRMPQFRVKLCYLKNKNKIRCNSKARFSHEHNCFENTDFISISRCNIQFGDIADMCLTGRKFEALLFGGRVLLSGLQQKVSH